MESKKEKKIQHYVPKCYLRKFGIDKKSIYKFSKNDNSYEKATIRNCCQIEDFYTINNRSKSLYIEEDILDHREENAFGLLLDKLRIFSKNYLNGKTVMFTLSDVEQEILARCISVQYLRGPRYRHAVVQREMKSDYAKITNLCNRIGFDFDIEEIVFQYDEANIHGDIIASNSIVSEHQNYIWNKNWEFLFSSDYFFTSDEPVVVIPMNNIPVLPHETLKYFHKIFFPLNSHLLLKINHSQNNANNNCIGFREILIDELEAINKLIIKNSRENYFCEIIKKNGKT